MYINFANIEIVITTHKMPVEIAIGALLWTRVWTHNVTFYLLQHQYLRPTSRASPGKREQIDTTRFDASREHQVRVLRKNVTPGMDTTGKALIFVAKRGGCRYKYTRRWRAHLNIPTFAFVNILYISRVASALIK